jgi:hypothetical protein
LIGKSLEVAKKIAYKTTNYVHFCDLRNSAHIKKKEQKIQSWKDFWRRNLETLNLA